MLRPFSTARWGGLTAPHSRRGSRGFTLIEILIVVVILGILASIVIPQFSNASQLSRENTLKDDLRYLRTQIGVYKAQHLDFNPGNQNGQLLTPVDQTFVAQMIQYTDVNGNLSTTGSSVFAYGPYLLGMPPMPLTSLTTIKIAMTSATMTPDNSTGWIYNPLTQDIIANSTGIGIDGIPYAQY